MSCLFAVQEIAELEEVAVYQRVVSCKVSTLNTWVAVMIENGNGEKRDNAFDVDSFHAL